MLEYVRLMVEIDNLHFTKSKKKGRMTFLVVMGGYAINEKRGIKEALELLKSLDLPLDSPWKYDPYFLIGTEKRLKVPDPQDHETRPGEEKLANKESYEVRQGA